MRRYVGPLGMAAFWFLALGAYAAGGRVHEQMGRQGWSLYLAHDEAMLPGLASFLSDDDLWHAYYSGCLFPDWGFAAGGVNRDPGEDCHWREFLDGYLGVLRAKYPPPWEHEAKRHIAFFFGAVTHDLTDIPWHFNEGANVAFENRGKTEDGTPDANLDTVCHLFTQANYGTLPGLQGSLWFPMDDILEAFAKRGKPVPAEQIEAGRRLLSAASVGTAAFGSLAYWQNKIKYPWTQQHYEDYYYGGVQHGAALSAMSIRYWYARLQDSSCLQNMPAYSCRPPGYIAHAPCRDSSIDSALPDNNAGAEPLLEVARDDAGNERRALLQFTLDDVPSAAKIVSANLWLSFAGPRGPDSAKEAVIDAYAVNRAWNAGHGVTNAVNGVDGRPASDDETTWKKPWQVPGCDGACDDRDATPAASAAISPSDRKGAWKAWDVTGLVQRWVAQPPSNHGVLLRLATPTGEATFIASEAFKSREDNYCGGTRIEQRPMLIIQTARK
jgi:hypothetical protein